MDGFGKKLKAMRKARKIRATEIASRALGNAPVKQLKSFANYLSRMERGEADNPSLRMLEHLARAFGAPHVSVFLAQLDGLQNAPLTEGISAPQNKGRHSGGAADVAQVSPTSLDDDSIRLARAIIELARQRDREPPPSDLSALSKRRPTHRKRRQGRV